MQGIFLNLFYFTTQLNSYQYPLINYPIPENNNSTFTTTLTPLAPLDANMTSSNKNKSATTPKVPTPPVQNQMTTKNFFTTRDKIHLDPQIKKEWQKTGEYLIWTVEILSFKVRNRNLCLEGMCKPHYDNGAPAMFTST